MLAKSIIAGTVLSLMAGGVVYFGTDLDTAAVKEKVAEKTAEMKAEISDKVMSGGQEDHPHSKKGDAVETETSTDMPSVKTASGKVIKAKEPTISSSSKSEDKKVKTAEATSPEKPQKKWLNQYLKSDTPEKQTKPTMEKTEEVMEEKADVAKDLMKSMGLTKDGAGDSDTGSFIVEDEIEELTTEEIETAEAEGFEERALETENIWVEKGSSETGRKQATRKMLHDIIKKDSAIFIGDDAEGEKKVEVKVIANEDGETTIETETIDMGDGKIMKIVKKTVKTADEKDSSSKKMRIKVHTDRDGKDGKNGKDGLNANDIKIIRMGDNITIDELITQAKPKDISNTVKIVMEQAEKIELPELRDRAYLDLVSYGLEHGNYKVASKALTKIEQVELRDTARNRMAVAYARDGNAEDAFGILEDIEVEALRDVMRLQVIEAMIAPHELSEDMR